MTNPVSIPGCRWAADKLLVRVRGAAKLALPQPLLRAASDAGVACVVNLLSKAEYLAAREDAAFSPVARVPATRSSRQRSGLPPVFMSYVFWPEPGLLPTVRQVRQAIDGVEDAHALGLRVLLNGVGYPARAAVVAGCWQAREGHENNVGRVGWSEAERATSAAPLPSFVLSAAERAFVAEWPTGREGQPELADTTWTERDEVFPFATVEHWLRVLPTVRVYPGVRGHVRPVDVPVLGGQRVSDGAGIDVDVDELRRGIWVGERTLRLPNGWQVVFNSPCR